MSYDMQASGFNSNASLTLIYANRDWSDAPQNPVLWVAAFGPTMPGVSDGSPNRDLDAVFAWGNFAGNGVIGWGGYKTGSGVVGVPGAATGDFDLLIKARGENIGVYGAAAGTNPAIGVLGEWIEHAFLPCTSGTGIAAYCSVCGQRVLPTRRLSPVPQISATAPTDCLSARSDKSVSGGPGRQWEAR